MVRNENVPESREGNAGEYELAGNPIATIDHVRRIVDEYDLRWRGPRFSWPRATSRAEEDQPHLVAALPGRRPRPSGRAGNGRPDEKSASIDSHLCVSRPYAHRSPARRMRPPASGQLPNDIKLSGERSESAAAVLGGLPMKCPPHQLSKAPLGRRNEAARRHRETVEMSAGAAQRRGDGEP